MPNFGDFVLSTSLDNDGNEQEIFVDSHRHKNGQDTLNNAVLTVNQIAPRGFESACGGQVKNRQR